MFLISLKAGGTGLNLTEADYVIMLDPWWNPAVEAQAVDRTHRIGQTRNVIVYRLVAKGTIEEKVMALKERKAALTASVLDGDDLASSALTADDIRTLLAERGRIVGDPRGCHRRLVGCAVEFDEVEALRRSHPAWRLLRADNAALVLSFLGRVFVEDNVRSTCAADLTRPLDDELYALNQRLGEGHLPVRRPPTWPTGRARRPGGCASTTRPGSPSRSSMRRRTSNGPMPGCRACAAATSWAPSPG